MPRFDVAAFLNMPLESEALSHVLLQLPTDDDWDLDDNLEKAMHCAAEKRYDMSTLKKTFKDTKHEEFMGETTSSSKEKKTKTKDFVPTADKSIVVKFESPVYVSYKQKMVVLKTGKGTFSNVLNSMRCFECLFT